MFCSYTFDGAKLVGLRAIDNGFYYSHKYYISKHSFRVVIQFSPNNIKVSEESSLDRMGILKSQITVEASSMDSAAETSSTRQSR